MVVGNCAGALDLKFSEGVWILDGKYKLFYKQKIYNLEKVKRNLVKFCGRLFAFGEVNRDVAFFVFGGFYADFAWWFFDASVPDSFVYFFGDF